MNRRQFLGTGCGGTMVALSGCISPFSSTVQLGGLSVVNYDDESKELDVRVSKDGSTVLNSTIELPPTDDPSISSAERKAIECTWDDDEGEYIIETGLNGDELESFNVAENADGDCTYVEIEIYWDGTINYNTTNCSNLAPGRREQPWGCSFLEE